MPLAKSAPQEPTGPTEHQEVTDTTGSIPSSEDVFSVPLQIYRYFSEVKEKIDTKDAAKIKDIFNYAKEFISEKGDEPSVGNILEKISEIEHRLGAPHFNERRYDKLWNYIKIEMHINDMRKQQDALRNRRNYE